MSNDILRYAVSANRSGVLTVHPEGYFMGHPDHERIVAELQQQLATERERVRRLEDALGNLLASNHASGVNWTSAFQEAEQLLASLVKPQKEGGE